MPQVRSLDRRPCDPTPEQIRIKCAEIRAGWAANGDKRYVPELQSVSVPTGSAKSAWSLD
jgi:hypothetical protein